MGSCGKKLKDFCCFCFFNVHQSESGLESLVLPENYKTEYFHTCSHCPKKMSVIYVKNKEDFDTKLADAGDQLIVVDFYASWCGPCKVIAPKLEELAKEFSSCLLILKVDVDECEDLATEYNVCTMPTFLFIKNKQVVAQFSGANYEKLRDTIVKNQ